MNRERLSDYRARSADSAGLISPDPEHESGDLGVVEVLAAHGVSLIDIVIEELVALAGGEEGDQRVGVTPRIPLHSRQDAGAVVDNGSPRSGRSPGPHR